MEKIEPNISVQDQALINKLKPVINLLRIPTLRARCPVCHGRASFDFRSPYFTICKCDSCEHAFVRDHVPRSELSKRYSGWDYWIKDHSHQGINSIDPGDYWKGYLEPRLNIINEWYGAPKSGLNLLEIGSSEGHLLYELQKKGFTTYGCEMNEEVVKKGKERFNQNIVCGDFLEIDFETNKFDLIISFHTFEHLTNLERIMEKCIKLLKKDGMLIIEVPFGPGEYGNPDHLHFFSEKSAQGLLKSYLHTIKIQTNSYITSENEHVGSYYVSGIK